MTVLTDELLRRRLAERAGRAAGAPQTSLAAIARSVSARPQRGASAPGFRTGWAGPIAAVLVVALAIGGGLIARGSLAPPGSLGAADSGPVRSGSPSATRSVASPSPSAEPSEQVSPLVTGCDGLGFDARRCTAIINRARQSADPPIRAEDVTAVSVARPTNDGVIRTTSPIAAVTFELIGGGLTTIVVHCGLPGLSDRVCSGDPQVHLAGGVSTDVPCGTTPGDEDHPCATLPPTPRPASVAASTPLILRTFDVVLDHVGHYEVLVGQASLPDGLLSGRSGTLADPRPTTWWIDSGVSIVVRPGKPCLGDRCPSIESIYHEPYDGPQPVNVYLVFDVVELESPGAILEVRSLIVR